MKSSKRKTGGRRKEPRVPLGEATIKRYNELFAQGDFARINEMVKTPPTTAATVIAQLKAAVEKGATVSESIANAAHTYFMEKEKRALVRAK